MRSKIVLVWLAILVLVPAAVTASGNVRPIGVAAGDRIVYLYRVHNSFDNATTGANETTDSYWNITIDIQSVITNSSLPDIGYHIKEDAIRNGNIINTYTENNLTTIFDPFDTGTYLGNLGFPAFIFTDVSNGTKNLGFNVKTNSLPPWATSNSTEVPQNVTVAVQRTPSSIDVALTDKLLKSSSPWMEAAVTYNPVTGVMQSSRMYTVLGGVYKDFFYSLLGFGQFSTPNYAYLWYGALGAVAVAVVVIGLSRRPSRREKKITKMRRS